MDCNFTLSGVSAREFQAQFENVTPAVTRELSGMELQVAHYQWTKEVLDRWIGENDRLPSEKQLKTQLLTPAAQRALAEMLGRVCENKNDWVQSTLQAMIQHQEDEKLREQAAQKEAEKVTSVALRVLGMKKEPTIHQVSSKAIKALGDGSNYPWRSLVRNTDR